MSDITVVIDDIQANELKLDRLERTLPELEAAIELRHASSNHNGPLWLCNDLICQALAKVQE